MQFPTPPRPYNVLLADDDAALTRILEMRLKKLGLHPTCTHDAMHALTLIHKQPPDLILMDITMPAGNGLAACEMLAADPRLKQIPVVILSGRGDQATRDRVAELGAHYVLKSGDLWLHLRPLLLRLLKMPDPRSAEHAAAG